MKMVLTLDELWKRLSLPSGTSIEIDAQFPSYRSKIDVTFRRESMLRSAVETLVSASDQPVEEL